MTLTHSRLSGHKKNLKLDKNPDSLDTKDAYLVKRIFVDNKDKFSSTIHRLQLDQEDEKKVENWFNNNKLFKQ